MEGFWHDAETAKLKFRGSATDELGRDIAPFACLLVEIGEFRGLLPLLRIDDHYVGELSLQSVTEPFASEDIECMSVVDSPEVTSRIPLDLVDRLLKRPFVSEYSDMQKRLLDLRSLLK